MGDPTRSLTKLSDVIARQRESERLSSWIVDRPRASSMGASTLVSDKSRCVRFGKDSTKDASTSRGSDTPLSPKRCMEGNVRDRACVVVRCWTMWCGNRAVRDRPRCSDSESVFSSSSIKSYIARCCDAGSRCFSTKSRMACRNLGLMQPHKSRLCSALWTGPASRSILTSRTRLGLLRAPSWRRSASSTSSDKALSIVSLDPNATSPVAA